MLESSDNNSKASGRLWHYYKYEPNDNLENSESFQSKVKITGNTSVKIIVPLKYLINFWRNLEMPLINCEVSLVLTWSSTWSLLILQTKEDLQ